MDSPKPAAPTQPLRLLALDAEDLALVSAHLQDAVVRVGDLAYLAKKKRFTAVASRFDWTAQSRGRLERCLAALHFETVRAVRYDGFARERSEWPAGVAGAPLRAGRDRARGPHPHSYSRAAARFCWMSTASRRSLATSAHAGPPHHARRISLTKMAARGHDSWNFQLEMDMTLRLDASAADFGDRFTALLSMKRESSPDVDHTVRKIIEDVVARGDEALIDYSRQFDRIDLAKTGIAVSAAEIAAAEAKCSREQLAALDLALERITVFHERQRPSDLRFTDDAGVELGWRWTPIESVGLYVPGGTAAYPSSVLMNVAPAKVAGVPRIVMVVPTPDGHVEPLVLAAARRSGITEIYRVGGAQAVAALAYGTKTIAPVAKIVGPGNAWVAAAKRRVFGQVGIDMIAGPSEVLVIADKTANPDWIAADLLAQAEHDESAQSILITDDAGLADAVVAAVERHLTTLIAQGDRQRVLARLRRRDRDEDAGRRAAARRPHRRRTSRNHQRGRRGSGRAGEKRRGDLHWRLYAGGGRRLCRRLQPCAAHGPFGAVLLGAERA